jgi:dihydrodiol dehydrogenase / D-xylose 1-dehydrogenase (NADP)
MSINANPLKSGPLRLGVVGAGAISRIVLPLLPKSTFEIAAISDVNLEAAASLVRDLSVAATLYQSGEELIEQAGLDAVYLATPPATHGALILAAARAGRAVICEKPWTRTATEASELLRELGANRFPPIAACTSRFVSTPAARAARECLAAKQLGRLRQVRLTASTALPITMEALPAWKRNAQTAGGGTVVDWGVYELDWLRVIVGEAFNPVEVTATLDEWRREGTGIETGYDVHLSCASGLDVRIRRRPEIGPRQHRVEIRGDRGGLDLPFAPDDAGKRAQLYRLDGEEKPVGPETISEPVEDWSQILSGPLVNLAQALVDGTPVMSPPDSQVFIHTVIDAIYESGRSGRSVRIGSETERRSA